MYKTACTICFCFLFTTFSIAQSVGDLDPSFNQKGFRIDSAVTSEFVNAVEMLPDGRILVAGTDIEGPRSGFTLRRFLVNGEADPSFGDAGFILADDREVEGGAVDIALQQDGKFLVMGAEYLTHDLIIQRRLANGANDPSFAQSGCLAIDQGNVALYGARIFTLPDDRILWVAPKAVGNQRSLTACRLLPDGNPDPSYGTNGYGTMPLSAQLVRTKNAILDEQGRLIILGAAGSNQFLPEFIARFDAFGNPDSTFGTNGLLTIPLNNFSNEVSALASHPDGSLFLAGTISPPQSANEVLIRKYDAAGQAVNGFGEAGIWQLPERGLLTYTNDLLVDALGNVIVVGHNGGFHEQLLVARLNADGQTDTDFAGKGWQVYDIGVQTHTVGDAVLGSDGRLVVAGSSFFNNSGLYTSNCTVARLWMGMPVAAGDAAFSIWPNPSDGVFNIGIELPADAVLSLTIVDMLGRKLQVAWSDLHLPQGWHEIPVDLTGLPEGNYVVQVKSGETLHSRIVSIR